MRKNALRTLALASILATGIAGPSAAMADDDDLRDDTVVRDPATPTTADDELRPSDAVNDPAIAPTAPPSATYSDTTLARGDTRMDTTASTPLEFDMFDQRWCVGDGASSVGCDVKVVAPGPDAFTMFGDVWCLNDAPGRTCDIRVRGNGYVPDTDDDDES